MLPHKHQVVGLQSIVTQCEGSEQALDMLHGLASILFLVDFLILLPDIDLNIVDIFFDRIISVALFSTLGFLHLVVTFDNFKGDHVTDH